jgi:hypothetical protein
MVWMLPVLLFTAPHNEARQPQVPIPLSNPPSGLLLHVAVGSGLMAVAPLMDQPLVGWLIHPDPVQILALPGSILHRVHHFPPRNVDGFSSGEHSFSI